MPILKEIRQGRTSIALYMGHPLPLPGTMWKYDRSLDNGPAPAAGLAVKAFEPAANGREAMVRFEEPMPYERYGISYFLDGSVFTPVDERAAYWHAGRPYESSFNDLVPVMKKITKELRMTVPPYTILRPFNELDCLSTFEAVVAYIAAQPTVIALYEIINEIITTSPVTP